MEDKTSEVVLQSILFNFMISSVISGLILGLQAFDDVLPFNGGNYVNLTDKQRMLCFALEIKGQPTD